ncbi:cytochrome c [Parahaliea sp. F7430]|uniref:Cytochrome c n=1 Tax=Sediminihaliea albiluteola TaxID=2758564 RepID=A0A7W2TUL8_9GAMM|nr:cytochrome c [Sediminihaliea albiluteola]MBA6412232.1 cytochrome c [Sediminihaliea albiluteola]
MKVYIKSLVFTGMLILVGGGLFLYSGVYPIGADTRHNSLTYWLLETLREHSVARAASDLSIPSDLNNSNRLLSGGADYNDMCVSCHLKPGMSESDFTLGLYPTPPNLSETAAEHGHDHASRADHDGALKRQFWIIKHGIKASGMPAWGPGHDDERIWSMVAFLQRLPELSAAQYQILSARDNSIDE